MENLPLGSSSLILNLAVLVVSLVLVAFFSSSEASLISVNKIRVRHLAEQGHKAAQAAQRVVQKHDKFFATILLTENAFIIFASSMGTAIAIGLFGPGEETVLLATLVMTVLVVTFGEITPKTFAVQAADRMALLVARPIEWVMALETPLIALFTFIPNLILRGLPHRGMVPSVTAAELRMIIDIGEAEGTVEETEKEMLHNVIAFADRYVREVMTPRPGMIWLNQDARLQDFFTCFSQSYHARFPVCQENPDNILGILYIKDLLRAMARGAVTSETPLTTLLRPAFFVPQTKKVVELFQEMREQRHQMAMVVDEFGGTAGLVTLKQIIEEIVGHVGDELQAGEKEFQAIDERTVQVDARMRIDEINEELGLTLPEGDYETVAGFLLDVLGHIPQSGEQVRFGDLGFTVAEMDGLRIEKVLVTRGG
ncbi:MAG: HlyC/CorC family transporter [Chloroflexi bacterium]|nr:HlyC/CorC family transporter [Chloroflexota bacterium]